NFHKTVRILNRWTSIRHSQQLPRVYRATHDDLLYRNHQWPNNPTQPSLRTPIYSEGYPSSTGHFRNKAVLQRHCKHTSLPAHFPLEPKLEKPEDKFPINPGSKRLHYTSVCSIQDHCVRH